MQTRGLMASRQQQRQQAYGNSSNIKARRKHNIYGLWWSRPLLAQQWTLQYAVVTQCLSLLLGIILCFIYIISKAHWHRSLFMLPLPTFHSYHIHQQQQQHEDHRRQHSHPYLQHHEHFRRAATTTSTIDSRNRANTHSSNVQAMPSSPLSTLFTYPKSMYLFYNDHNVPLSSSSLFTTDKSGQGSAVLAPTKPIHDALDWYDDKYGYHYTEPDFGGLYIRMLVVDDALLNHDEEASSSNRNHHHHDYDFDHSHGPRRPVYYNDRYYKDWYHSDDDDTATTSNINNNNIDEYNYYAFDDDAKRDPWRHRPMMGQTGDIKHNKKTCRRVSWHREMQLNCLNFHEFDFANHVLQGSSKYIG
jgi:hypothetical protein